MKPNGKIRFVDLFCGLGAFRIAAQSAFKSNGLEGECVFSCDIDPFVQEAYKANFGERPESDIKKVDAETLPDFELLLAGFPCQPFSIIGDGKGFDDTRGTLFFDIARILDAQKPAAFVLENVRQLVTHRKGVTFEKIIDVLKSLGYDVRHRVLNAIDYGLPQKRERVFIVGTLEPVDFLWPAPNRKMTPLSDILEANPPKKYYASNMIVEKRMAAHKSSVNPSIWHENKSGNVSSHPFSCALRAGASYNYLLVNGERRLTPREMMRLNGFPDAYKIVCKDFQTRKQAGNTIAVPVAEAVLNALVSAMIAGRQAAKITA